MLKFAFPTKFKFVYNQCHICQKENVLKKWSIEPRVLSIVIGVCNMENFVKSDAWITEFTIREWNLVRESNCSKSKLHINKT